MHLPTRLVRSGLSAPAEPLDPSPPLGGPAGGRAGPSLVRRGCRALVDLVLPAVCAGCAGVGTRWCPGCATQLAGCLLAAPRHTEPSPPPAGLPPVVTAGWYAGALRAALVQFKDGGRGDLRGQLAPPLARALARCPCPAGVVVVPMPSSAAAVRRRGEAPVELLARAAADRLPEPARARVVAALRVTRTVADQAGLGQAARAANVAGAYAVRPSCRASLAGSPVLLVDDVLTTGATLAEGARAVRAAGGRVLGAAVVAATRRHSW